MLEIDKRKDSILASLQVMGHGPRKRNFQRKTSLPFRANSSAFTGLVSSTRFNSDHLSSGLLNTHLDSSQRAETNCRTPRSKLAHLTKKCGKLDYIKEFNQTQINNIVLVSTGHSRPSIKPKFLFRFQKVAKCVAMLCLLYRDHHLFATNSYGVLRVRRWRAEEKKNPGTDQEILFDLTSFRAKTKIQLRVSETVKWILSRPPQDRSEQDVHFILTALQEIRGFGNYSGTRQKKVAKAAWYASYEAQQVMVQQGHIPHSFYICLSGSAIVIKKNNETGQVKPAWFLSKGDAFGDKEILNSDRWPSSVIIQEPAEFLCLDREDFAHIFLPGGRKKQGDPEQIMFLSELKFLKGWPLQLLEDNPGKCIVKHFSCAFPCRRGAVILQTSSINDWIYIVRSGSCSVMKVFKMDHGVEAIFPAKRKKQSSIFQAASTLVHPGTPTEGHEHEKIILDKHPTKTQQKKRTVRHDEGKENAPSVSHRTGLVDFNPQRTVNGSSSPENQVWGVTEDSECGLRERHPNTIVLETKMDDKSSKVNKLPSPMKSAYLRARLVVPSPVSEKLEAEKDKTDEMNLSKTTITKPAFIMIDTLVKGSVFGLSDFLFSDQPSCYIISNGAECLQISKKFYLDNASQDVLDKLRQQQHPYPGEKELLERLQKEMQWQTFRKLAICSTLQRIERKQNQRQHGLPPDRSKN
ncbi:uncharacterized protein LOC117413909 isoform X1 [Acipenser ruthenus]|uniref:uncharacterized protein LOC117413909 isoform X1 n=1 Tax=Acipenser ruthenus TaxID=7906 RepID=UPI002740BDDE|nr:uncharacterized protein LOC117413909 isoform X1 [Acipenser ruthenus]